MMVPVEVLGIRSDVAWYVMTDAVAVLHRHVVSIRRYDGCVLVGVIMMPCNGMHSQTS